MTLTERMAEYIVDYKIADKGNACKAAGLNFLDTVGCMMAGTMTKQFQLVKEYAATYRMIHQAGILGLEGRVDAGHAAMAHSVAAHACDYDDMCTHLNGHPSAVIVPVVLALEEVCEKRVWEMLEAYMAGVEISSAFGRMFNEDNYSKAWNQTTTLGIMGAVAAAGKMMDLSKDEMTHALGIGIGESSGNKANFGTMTKDLTVGFTAMKAIACAEFARRGFTANRSVIEGNNGFFQTTGKCISARPLTDFLESGESAFLNPGLIIKPYPTCRGNHNVIDIVLAMIENHALKAKDIQEVVCRVQNTVMDTERYPNPESGAEGKFSIAYCVALCLLKGHLDIPDFQRSEINDPDLLKQMEKVRVSLNPEIKNARFGAEVTVKTGRGRIYKSTGYYAKGDPVNPMSGVEIRNKFVRNASIWMGTEAADGLANRFFQDDGWMEEDHLLNMIENAARGEFCS